MTRIDRRAAARALAPAWPFLLLSLVAAPASGAQEEDPPPADAPAAAMEDFPSGVEVVDRIVAVVGDTAVLMSDLTVTLYQLQARGARTPPPDSPEWDTFARQVLTAMIDDLIFLQQAKIAGTTVDENQVNEMADGYYEQTRSQFSSDEEMMLAVEETGMNMLQYRQMLRTQAEAEAMRRTFRFTLEDRSDLPSVIVSEEEIEAAFNDYAADQPPLPARVSFNQLVVTPSPSGEAKDSALARARRVQSDLVQGDDFSIIARRHSDDESTRERGGELGWMRRDLLVKPFGDAAWQVRPGQVAGPIQTQYGMHFIQVERQRGAERFLRHILLQPDIRPEDVEEARKIAVEVADSLRAGIDPELIAGYFSGKVADDVIRFDDRPLTSLLDQFAGPEDSGIATPVPGTVYGPLAMERGGPTEFGLIHILTFRPEGPVELDDVRDDIRTSLRTQKQIEILLGEIRSNTFVDIRL